MTTLTPEFWERFAVLLVLAVGLTAVLTAALDTLAVRLLRRPNRGTHGSHRTDRSHRTPPVAAPLREAAPHSGGRPA